MGVNAGPASKANGDYRKRTADPGDLDPSDTTFMFVTPRRWSGKEEWVSRKKEEGVWKDVVAYDADDLESWMERAPAVHAWVSALLGKDPYEAESLETWWDSWSAATRPPLPPSLLLSGREATVERVREALASASTVLTLSADSQEEAVAFVAAALISMEASTPHSELERALLVRTAGAWRRFAVSERPLVLLPLYEKPDVTLATRHGHVVILPLGREVASGGETEIPRLRRHGIEVALTEAGLSQDRATGLATLGRRSLLSLRRTLAVSREVQAPEWSRPENARDVLPVVLAGQWQDNAPGDRAAIAELTGQPYEEVVEALTRWSNSSDPPVRRVGNVWIVAAKHDAWMMTARSLTPDDLQRFRYVVKSVVGGDDPLLDLSPQERIVAPLFGKQRPHSGHLIEGLADTLALVAATSETVPLTGGQRGQDQANVIVRELLNGANEDASGRRWTTLSNSLPLLAEAAPDVFLAAVEAGLRGEDPVILKLFQDGEGFDLTFGSSAHTGLLWALEGLAWSPEYLGRAALLLAKLTRLDPGGRLGNRPGQSLKSILLLWRPGTGATLEQRLQVVDLLRRREPEVSWRLMLDLIPSGQESATSPHAPRRRDWTLESPQVLWRDFYNAVDGLAVRALEDAGASGQRWAALIRRTEDLPPTSRGLVIEALQKLEPGPLDEEGRAVLVNALRSLVGRHRAYPDADWALPQPDLDRLEALIPAFEPDNPTAKYAWLFAEGALYSFLGEDHDSRRDAWHERQRAAIREIYAEVGLDGLLRWAEHFKTNNSYPAHQIGWALASAGLDRDTDGKLFSELLSGVDARRVVAAAYVSQAARAKGADWMAWAKATVQGRSEPWSPQLRAVFLSVLSSAPQLWDLVETLGEETEREYWQRVQPYGLPERGDACIRAARKLMEYNRPYDAVDLLDMYADDLPSGPPPELVAEAMEQAIRKEPPSHLDSMFSYHVRRHLDRLEKASFDEKRLAALEWMYLPLFRYDERRSGVLIRELATDPGFFVQIASIAYRADDEEPRELSEQEQLQARTASELLDSWRQVPGVQDDGTVDGGELRRWVTEARRLLAECRRLDVGDQMIGRVLRYGPAPEEGAWPAEPIRDLIEEVESENIERGLQLEVYNSRGATWRGQTDGGQQERQLAVQYRGYAAAVGVGWPRTVSMLKQIAETYERDAQREDLDAELTEDLWR
jgi:hypothetical protein